MSWGQNLILTPSTELNSDPIYRTIRARLQVLRPRFSRPFRATTGMAFAASVSSARRVARAHARTAAWPRLADEDLLGVRLRDLNLRFDSTLARCVRRLYAELERAGLKFRPHCWLAEEWFSPDGIPGIAIPFYLSHARLRRLERRMMREVEGGNTNWMMRILRHEAGHAIDSAYRLRRRTPLARDLRTGVAAVPRQLSSASRQPAFRAAPRFLVRAESSDRGLRRDLRRVAEAAGRRGGALTTAGRRSRSCVTSMSSCARSSAVEPPVRCRA